MHRSSALIISLSIITGSAFADQIQIGGATGLTSSYIGASNTGGWTERNYDNYLFDGANNGSPTSPYGGYQQHSGASGTITDSTDGVTFNMVNDGCVGGTCNGTAPSANVWVASGTGTLTIPIGVFDVQDVWTMLSNVYGAAGAQDTTVKFNFGSTATTTNGTSLTVNLVNASSNMSANSGQIGTAIECTGLGTSTCNTLAIGGLAPSSSLNGITSSSTLIPITVDTNTVYSTTYTSTIGGTSAFASSNTGTLSLYDQGFIFGNTYSNLYLVNLQVTDSFGTMNTSQTALSAITVDTAATPEPSTIWLGFTGMFAVGLVVLRRRRVA